MFTGLIEQQGRVRQNQQLHTGNRLVVSSTFSSIQPGESIAVNGACLSVLPSRQADLQFDLSPETLAITNLGELKPGDFVNLERSMTANARFGGHYVNGHVDCIARVAAIRSEGEFKVIFFGGFQTKDLMYLIPKGSITIEGVSLTINAVQDQRIECMLIPHTLSQTTLDGLQEGQSVNIEFDYLSRIVAHQLQFSGQLKQEVTTCL